MGSQLVNSHFRLQRLPHIWCPGCGHGIIMRALAQAIDNLKLDKDKICLVSGIGCSSRAPGYMDYNTLHTLHGRALAFATGVKLANPDLKVIVITGDGDCTAIGGNHLIHASRRNIDITTIVFNNNIYGMTGGQYSPTTPTNEFGTTAPFGNIDQPFDICKLVDAAGATFVGRGTAYHAIQLSKLIEQAIDHTGFSLVDAISTCPTYYGRKNNKGSAFEMLNALKDATIDVKVVDKVPPEKKKDKILTGILKNTTEPEYAAEYLKIIEKLQKGR
ncbi:thiamine pyrophosphate protein domain protein TPP-binding [Alkaliphilus metalliredigens QYMF]|uniref:Thiamine pyrophosphate protein domain protein TPP-binding n=1 Tax=Alkaliphilus metalliredigens (strain QYMF) TaxID=293826 RepID=A6TRG7_ALKMQ|nr:2-oxoacid:ferredoxin oxidoreductase subunit beta [Alkaliphilus metalliredigens]ABR48785.1 thiamine pyrophosphate protein domain protein TPP-binding [Alkaliphilus metalliredigens QYMF]